MYLLPKPKKVTEKEGCYEINYQTTIVLSGQIKVNGITYAAILQKGILEGTGIKASYIRGKAENGDISLDLSEELNEQEYRLIVKKTGVSVVGGDGAGVLYGVQTLCQMFIQYGGVLPCVEISDEPDMKNRGYFLDETRGRVLTLPYLKKVVDRLSRYKLNQFQLYVEHTYLFRNLSEMWRDETPLTAEDIMELDDYCRERHIELIPSLASFGHLYMLLSTKSYGHLCELEDSWREPFSFWDRMRHHTVNVTDEETMPLIKGMIDEYMALFTSDKFNICADETFDLGKGKSKEAAERDGVHRIYINYIKELCEYLVEKKKQPMFWGDIICGEPELIRELPENTICLTWGYAPDQREHECRVMAEAGARQYLCPGVGGWNRWMNLIRSSYDNIIRMCGYGRKYRAEGILNTDWGDCGHINHPEYSVPGLIYGAAFSWNPEVIDFDEINRQISWLEFHDSSGQIVGFMAEMAKQSLYNWWDAVIFYENYALNHAPEERLLPEHLGDETACREAAAALKMIARGMKKAMVSIDSGQKELTEALLITADAIDIWNEIGAMTWKKEKQIAVKQEDAAALAGRLENWFMFYKKLWRTSSREGDLHHISEIVFWYADFLRGRGL